MDRHVRWFRREIAVGLAQRIVTESFVVGILVAVGLALTGNGVINAAFAGAIAVPAFATTRFGLGCIGNPVNSLHLLRWPHPSGDVIPVEQTNLGSITDTTLKSFQFTPSGALDEWNGAKTNVFTRDSNQIIVTSSDDDDLIAISALDDDRLVLTTKQLIPPHERLIINRRHESDVRAVLASHVDLVKDLTNEGGHQAVRVGIDHVIEALAIEWDAWDQIGPLLGPFVAVGQKRQPTLVQILVSAEDMLRRTGSPAPRITAQRANAPVLTPGTQPNGQLASPAPQLARATAPQPAPEPVPPHHVITVRSVNTVNTAPGEPQSTLPAPAKSPAQPPAAAPPTAVTPPPVQIIHTAENGEAA